MTTIDGNILVEIKVGLAEVKRDIANLREIFELTANDNVKIAQCELLRQGCVLKAEKLWKTVAVVVGALLIGSEGVKQLLPILKGFL